MTIKTSLLGIPFGGAKGGVRVDPHQYTEKDLKRIARGYSQAIHRFIGSDVDIPAPDMGTDDRLMDIMTAQYQNLKKTHANDMFTGKSIGFGGSFTRKEATGAGMVHCINRWATTTDEAVESFVVQGFGNVGSNASVLLARQGVKCIGIGDHTCNLYNPNGFDVVDVQEYVEEHKCLQGYHHGNDSVVLNKTEFLGIETDLFIFAACELQVCGKEADLLNCKVVVEGANGPIDLVADELLKSKNIDVVPDILANAGGVYVSYLEWVGNRKKMHFSAVDEKRQLQDIMEKKFDQVWKKSSEKQIGLREAAYLVALDHLWFHYDRKNGE
jgi:glutamate dehydrogenase (NAD(P)+)